MVKALAMLIFVVVMIVVVASQFAAMISGSIAATAVR